MNKKQNMNIRFESFWVNCITASNFLTLTYIGQFWLDGLNVIKYLIYG